jgi:hypothetical protein
LIVAAVLLNLFLFLYKKFKKNGVGNGGAHPHGGDGGGGAYSSPTFAPPQIQQIGPPMPPPGYAAPMMPQVEFAQQAPFMQAYGPQAYGPQYYGSQYGAPPQPPGLLQQGVTIAQQLGYLPSAQPYGYPQGARMPFPQPSAPLFPSATPHAGGGGGGPLGLFHHGGSGGGAARAAGDAEHVASHSKGIASKIIKGAEEVAEVAPEAALVAL